MKAHTGFSSAVPLPCIFGFFVQQIYLHLVSGVFALLKLFCFRGCISRSLLVLAFLSVLLGSERSTFAQTPTAPQILPYLITTIAGGASTSPGAGHYARSAERCRWINTAMAVLRLRCN